jgi:hypothetical protein
MKPFVVGMILAFSIAAASCSADDRGTCTEAPSFALLDDEPRGPFMRPGDNCLRCHSSSGEAKRKVFSFGGTVFAKADSPRCAGGEASVTIRVTDSVGKTVSVITNEVGNFWSKEPLTPPLSMEARRGDRVAKMPIDSPTGGCALCHRNPNPVSGALGRIRTP